MSSVNCDEDTFRFHFNNPTLEYRYCDSTEQPSFWWVTANDMNVDFRTNSGEEAGGFALTLQGRSSKMRYCPCRQKVSYKVKPAFIDTTHCFGVDFSQVVEIRWRQDLSSKLVFNVEKYDLPDKYDINHI